MVGGVSVDNFVDGRVDVVPFIVVIAGHVDS